MDGFKLLFEHGLFSGALKRLPHPSSLLFIFQPGWEERVHTDGRTFYIDHSKTTFCLLHVLSGPDHLESCKLQNSWLNAYQHVQCKNSAYWTDVSVVEARN